MDSHPVVVSIRDNGDYIRVLIYSCYATITGCGVLLKDRHLDGSSPESLWIWSAKLERIALDLPSFHVIFHSV